MKKIFKNTSCNYRSLLSEGSGDRRLMVMSKFPAHDLLVEDKNYSGNETSNTYYYENKV